MWMQPRQVTYVAKEVGNKRRKLETVSSAKRKDISRKIAIPSPMPKRKEQPDQSRTGS
jgi:hypothetical protein